MVRPVNGQTRPARLAGTQERVSGVKALARYRKGFIMARSKLVEILKEHGVRAYEQNGHIYALDTYQDAGGFVHDHFVRLRASLRVVRAFLGY